MRRNIDEQSHQVLLDEVVPATDRFRQQHLEDLAQPPLRPLQRVQIVKATLQEMILVDALRALGQGVPPDLRQGLQVLALIPPRFPEGRQLPIRLGVQIREAEVAAPAVVQLFPQRLHPAATTAHAVDRDVELRGGHPVLELGIERRTPSCDCGAEAAGQHGAEALDVFDAARAAVLLLPLRRNLDALSLAQLAAPLREACVPRSSPVARLRLVWTGAHGVPAPGPSTRRLLRPRLGPVHRHRQVVASVVGLRGAKVDVAERDAGLVRPGAQELKQQTPIARKANCFASTGEVLLFEPAASARIQTFPSQDKARIPAQQVLPELPEQVRRRGVQVVKRDKGGLRRRWRRGRLRCLRAVAGLVAAPSHLVPQRVQVAAVPDPVPARLEQLVFRQLALVVWVQRAPPCCGAIPVLADQAGLQVVEAAATLVLPDLFGHDRLVLVDDDPGLRLLPTVPSHVLLSLLEGVFQRRWPFGGLREHVVVLALEGTIGTKVELLQRQVLSLLVIAVGLVLQHHKQSRSVSPRGVGGHAGADLEVARHALLHEDILLHNTSACGVEGLGPRLEHRPVLGAELRPELRQQRIGLWIHIGETQHASPQAAKVAPQNLQVA
mmetsp:Transcript_133023/g.384739  ORF Transcript_133023/g.384739 Transcript_133023/m.384739 type:complete len:609 (+) Transcript_133023:937-2763(+)